MVLIKNCYIKKISRKCIGAVDQLALVASWHLSADLEEHRVGVKLIFDQEMSPQEISPKDLVYQKGEAGVRRRALTLMLQTQTGKNRCARARAHHLRLCSPRTGFHVRSSTLLPVQACAQPHLARSDAFFLGVVLQH